MFGIKPLRQITKRAYYEAVHVLPIVVALFEPSHCGYVRNKENILRYGGRWYGVGLQMESRRMPS
jgi:hypothetical protein